MSEMLMAIEIASQMSTSQAYWVILAIISNIANHLKYNYFWDCDGIECHVATLKILRFLLKTHCRRHGWWYHVPHSSYDMQASDIDLSSISMVQGAICELKYWYVSYTCYFMSYLTTLYWKPCDKMFDCMFMHRKLRFVTHNLAVQCV